MSGMISRESSRTNHPSKDRQIDLKRDIVKPSDIAFLITAPPAHFYQPYSTRTDPVREGGTHSYRCLK